MKISQMATADGLDLMLKFIPITARIIEDTELSNAKAVLTSTKSGAEIAAKITPILLANHRDDVMELVAVMQGETVDEVKKQPISSTIETLAEGVKLFAAFFPASLHLVASA